MEKKQETMLKYGFVVIGALLVISIFMSWSTINRIDSLALLFIQGAGLGGAGGQAQAPTQPTQRAPAPSPIAEVSLEGAYYEGADPDKAKVVIVEYSDFQCPFCGRFYSQTLPTLKQKYIDGRSDVSFVYKHFPLSFHPEAQSSAEASECAGEQGKFWEFHDLLFDNQQALSRSGYTQWAQQLGLDTTQFDSCLDTGKFRSKVQSDFSEGQSDGVSGTPTLFINGNRIVGAQPTSVFEQAIDAELTG